MTQLGFDFIECCTTTCLHTHSWLNWFDGTTWRYGGMPYLHEAGRGRIPIFLANFVINRKFSVRIGNTLSEIYDQEEGVPQGIILVVTVLLQ